MAVDAACLHRPFKGHPPDTLEPLRQELISLCSMTAVAPVSAGPPWGGLYL
jgi:hypothetical protein